MMGIPNAQVAGAPGTVAMEEGGECSSYGTGESEEEGEQEIAQNVRADAGADVMQDIKRYMANMEATATYIVEKLASLEKAVMAAQEDMVWVRADQTVVHEVVENLVEHVSTLNPTVVEVEGVAKGDASPVCAWGNWEQPAHAKEGDPADSMGAGRGSHETYVLDTEIQETQAMDMNPTLDGNITSLADEDGVAEWYENRAGSPACWSPKGTQPRRQEADDPVEDGCEQMEMTLAGPEVGTVAPGGLVWEAFKSTMRDMQAPVHGGRDDNGGWIRSKRGREGTSELGAVKNVGPTVEAMASHANLNLNLSPENLTSHDAMQGKGSNVAQAARGTGSRGRGRGSGRGTGRVKRPPPVNPRYRSMASAQTMHLHVCTYTSHYLPTMHEISWSFQCMKK